MTGGTMSEPNFFMLYVDNPTTSAAFYTQLLDYGPIEASPTFVMFALKSGVMFCLWSKHTVEPTALCAGGGTEVAFTMKGKEEVITTYAAWKAQGLSILQEPTKMGFGYTFVALDPDGHRLRVFTPDA